MLELMPVYGYYVTYLTMGFKPHEILEIYNGTSVVQE